MAEYLFHPTHLLNSLKRIKGVHLLKHGNNVNAYLDAAIECAQEWTEDWDDDQGFGSSDSTYALKGFIDDIISIEGLSLKTVFSPYLTIEGR